MLTEILTVCGYIAVLFVFAALVGELLRVVMDEGMEGKG